MKVPPDLDQLMWFLAESGDEAAMSEFRKRFPEFEIELMRRQSIVRGLRSAKPDHAPTPTFSLRDESAELESPSRRWVWPVAAVGLVAVALASYQFTVRMQATPDRTPVGPPTSESVARPPESRPSGLLTTPPTPENPPVGDANDPNVTPPIRENAVAAWERPTTIQIEDTPLVEAIAQIAQLGGLQFELAPNMPNPSVSVAFAGISPVDMLRELGKAHGFTPLEQERGRYLIVPALDWTDLR